MSEKNGGTAFPSHEHFVSEPTTTSGERLVVTGKPHGGMSLRDYFAAKEPSWPPLTWWQSRVGDHVMSSTELCGVELSQGLAAWRYQCADAMLKERAK